MCGLSSPDARRDSWRNRCRKRSSRASSGARTFKATREPSGDSARYTVPVAPSPIGDRTRKPARTVPVETSNAIRGELGKPARESQALATRGRSAGRGWNRRRLRGGGRLAVAVTALLLRGQAEEDGRDADDEERRPDLRAVVREAEQPRRDGEQRAGADVEQVVHGHRGDLPDAELVVREQAVRDQADAEHDREHRRRRVVRELEDPRRRDQERADDV